MTIFVINVGDTGYADYSIPLIRKLCEFNNADLFILDKDIPKNIYKRHPSWLKLFCHSLVDDDFILCWDLDLVPTKLYDLNSFFDKKKINMCVDSSLLRGHNGFNKKFKYNCGLIGVPKNFSKFFESVYDECAPKASYPSYEQYYVNDKIFDTNTIINTLNNDLNYFFNGIGHKIPDVYNVHYTWKIMSNRHRIELIENHYKIYGKNF